MPDSSMPQDSKLPVKTSYVSVSPPIPSDFLIQPPEKPITFSDIDFASSTVPEYANHIVLLAENVLSPKECQQLLGFAEASVPRENPAEPTWRPALVNAGGGWEIAVPSYRKSDRII